MASEHSDSADEPQQFGDFTLLSKLGEGSSAEVFLAQQNSLGVKVALKRWRRPLGDADRTAFLQECQLQQQLSDHPNIVRIRWAEAKSGEPPWIAMDLYEVSLRERLQDPDPIVLADAFRWADEILSGLAAVHEAGHVHRDVKTANVLIAKGTAALGDLGITMRVDAATDHAASGTAGFVAPELTNDGVPTFRSDVYSAAVTLRALFGHQVPGPVEALLTRATSHDPADRPADAGEFRSKLAALRPAVTVPPSQRSETTSVPASASRVPSTASSGPRVRRRRRGLLVIPIVAAICAGVLLAGLTMLRTSGLPGMVGDDVSVPPADTSSTTATSGPPPTSATSRSPSSSTARSTTASESVPTKDPSPTWESDDPPNPSTAPASSVKPITTPPTTVPSKPKPKPTRTSSPTKTRAPESDGAACYDTARLDGYLELRVGETNAGGPNYTSASCRDLHIKLTSAIYRTYARACFETANGSITHCGKWILLSYPDTWDTLATSVPAGSRWQLQMRADGDEDVEFHYTQ
jgi:serine/threonine-protein kinase